MHQGIPLLLDTALALAAAFAGGLLARRLGLPTMVGYLAAGVAIGPFAAGLVGDVDTIQQLAELGIVFLMFGVGLHFSFQDLWRVRGIAVPGAVGQMLVASAAGFGLTRLWGWSIPAGLVMGLAVSIASTIVLLRSLVDNGLLSTPQGRVAIGWLVLEDLATVVVLVLLPSLWGGGGDRGPTAIGGALLRAAAFAGLMLLVGTRLAPWILTQIVHTRSRELFILAVVAIALGTAVGSAELFGVSLALGAFLAGVVLAESTVGYQVGAEVLPFRETFAVLFFVSVGMLVNMEYLVANAGRVLALATVVVLGKFALTVALGVLLPCPARTVLVVAAGLSQIGEFSFIVGQAGVSLGILTRDQYSLILAGSLLSIMANPAMFRAVPRVEHWLRRAGPLWQVLDRHGPTSRRPTRRPAGHVVVVGYGRVGHHAVTVMRHLGVPRLVVELDGGLIRELAEAGETALYGDAANSEVLKHTGVEDARALVVTVAEEASAQIIVATARQMAPELPVVVRAATRAGVERLAQLGATDVVYPELEGSVEIIRHTLLRLGYPMLEVQQYADALRRTQYGPALSANEEHRVLEQLMRAVRGIEIAWAVVGAAGTAAGTSLAELSIEPRTGASVIAVLRDQRAIANPVPETVLCPGDLVGLIGEASQVERACRLLESERTPEQGAEEWPTEPPAAACG